MSTKVKTHPFRKDELVKPVTRYTDAIIGAEITLSVEEARGLKEIGQTVLNSSCTEEVIDAGTYLADVVIALANTIINSNSTFKPDSFLEQIKANNRTATVINNDYALADDEPVKKVGKIELP